MKSNDKLALTKEQLAENPAVDPEIVEEALKMRLELERLGVWERSGNRVVCPPENRPATNPFGSTRRQFVTQTQ